MRVMSDSVPQRSVISVFAAAELALVVNDKMRGTLDVGSAVAVSVADGVNVAVAVGVIDGVNVSVGKLVLDGVDVAVLVAVGVFVPVSVAVGVSDGVGVLLGVKDAITATVGNTTASLEVPRSHAGSTSIRIDKHMRIGLRNLVVISHIMKKISCITFAVMILLFATACQPSVMAEVQLPTLAVLPTALPTTLPTRIPHIIPTETLTPTTTTTFTPPPTFTLPFAAATDIPPTQRSSLVLDATLPVSLAVTPSTTPGILLPTNTLPMTLSFTTTGTPLPSSFVVGYSAGARPIVAQTFGTGGQVLMLVGGIHGGWEANTVNLIQELVGYFAIRPEEILPEITLLFIASANPDGLLQGHEISGRFNDNSVDLNRNWGCEWSSEAEWREGPVNPGERAFSEPESQALAALIQQVRPATVLFYHSAADGIFEGNCDNTTHSLAMAAVLGDATGYSYGQPFSAYTVTGTASNWVDGQGIPSADVELTRWQETEFTRNLRGVMALQCWLAGETANGLEICRQ